MKLLRMVDAHNLKKEAKSLRSEGDNLEYDRALIELVTFSLGGTSDDFLKVGAELGMSDEYVCQIYKIKGRT